MSIGVLSIADLAEIIKQRKFESSTESYTGMLLNKGNSYIERKLLEETMEVILESHDCNREKLLNEISDLLYHILVLATYHGLTLHDIERALASKNNRCSVIDSSLLRRLEVFRDDAWPFSSEQMLKCCDLSESDVTDVWLFSHNFRRESLDSIRVVNRFSNDAKALKNAIQGHQVKVKYAVPPDQQEEFRRDAELVIPILFIANAICLPIVLNILAAYIKDRLDKTPKALIDQSAEIQISMGIKKSAECEERWFTIKGSADDVRTFLEKNLKAPDINGKRQ